MKLIEEINSLAATHEAEGGACKTITVKTIGRNLVPLAVEVKCCLDGSGNVQGNSLSVLAYLHR